MLLLTTGSMAAAQEGPSVTDDGFGVIDTEVLDPGAPGGRSTQPVSGPSAGTADGPVCDSIRRPQLDDPGPPPRQAYLTTCDDGTASYTFTAAGGPPPPQVTPEQLAQRAVNQLQLPKPQVGLSPDPAKQRYQLVNLPTWWWTNNWSALSQRTQAGAVFAEVTATPVLSSFDGGDDSKPATCTRAGLVWRTGLNEQDRRACRFSYQRSNENVTATISTSWRVTWVGSGGTAGTLDPNTTSSTQPLTVYERQAVVTYGRG